MQQQETLEKDNITESAEEVGKVKISRAGCSYQCGTGYSRKLEQHQ